LAERFGAQNLSENQLGRPSRRAAVSKAETKIARPRESIDQLSASEPGLQPAEQAIAQGRCGCQTFGAFKRQLLLLTKLKARPKAGPTYQARKVLLMRPDQPRRAGRVQRI
jgi:hypothetical protein